jgi:hypothetical protein
MLHMQIKNEEIIERYVRNRLAPEERHAFEQHFFSCDECFEMVQAMEQFVAGVRDAAQSGTLAGTQESARVVSRWLTWALAFSTCAAVALAIAVAWLTLGTLPKLRSDLNATTAQVRSQEQILARLQEGPIPQEMAEANVPLVMLQAERGNGMTEAVLPPGAKRILLWAEIGPTRFRSYRMEVYSSSGTLVESLDGLVRGPYGALVASLPADQLQAGVFRITLTGQVPTPASLVGEYRLRIRKP